MKSIYHYDKRKLRVPTNETIIKTAKGLFYRNQRGHTVMDKAVMDKLMGYRDVIRTKKWLDDRRIDS